LIYYQWHSLNLVYLFNWFYSFYCIEESKADLTPYPYIFTYPYTLQAIIRGKVSPDSIIHSDGWRGYNGLVDIGYKKHYRVHHGANEFARGKKHINGIESFWSYSKNRLLKFHGISQNTFYLHLKECEFRFNYRDQNLYSFLLKLFREKPLN